MRTSRFHILVRTLGYLVSQRTLVGVALGAGIVLTLARLSVPWIMKQIFDVLTTHGGMARLERDCVLVVITWAAIVLSGAVKDYFTTLASQRILVSLRSQISIHLGRLPFSYFQIHRTGYLMAAFTSDAPSLVTLFSPVADEAFLALFQFAVTLLILVHSYGWLTLLVPIALAIYLLVPILVATKIRRCGDEIQTKNAELAADVQESLAATREIRVFGRQAWIQERLEESFRALLPPHCRITAMEALGYANILLYWVVVAAIYALGGRKILAGEMSLGSLVALIWYIGLLDDPLRRLSNLQGKLQTALAAATRIFAILDIPTAAVPVISRNSFHVKGHLTFENVSFSYSTGDSSTISGVSFDIMPGQRLAIVGRSGAGKTTLASLIVRLHDCISGRVLIDGIDVRTIDLNCLHQQIAMVSQDVFLFNTSVRENIRFGRLANDEEIIQAAQSAEAHEFIMALPDRYNTVVGERGWALSGGEKQRLALARALLSFPWLLILDEATSALDATTEEQVYANLHKLMRGRTIIAIHHNLSILDRSDVVLMLENGRAVGLGTHAELMQECKQYQSFCKSVKQNEPANLEH